MRILLLAILLVGAAIPANAEKRYSTWQSPSAASDQSLSSGENTRLQELIDKINTLVDEAEKARAADPLFMRDIRELTRIYDWPWRHKLFSEQFADDEYKTNPTWTVSAGRFWVERGWGLRTVVENDERYRRESEYSEDATDNATGGDDVAAKIFGEFLNQALGGDSRRSQRRRHREPAHAVISSAVPIHQAFAISFEFSSWQEKKGRLMFGPYLRDLPNAGYRLSYSPGGTYQLLRITRRGASVIQSVEGEAKLEDRRKHQIQWTRDHDGQTKISIDGKPIIDAKDRGFRREFAGFQLFNQGGDYIINKVMISGAGN